MSGEIINKLENVTINDKADKGDVDDDFVDPWTVVSKSESGIDYDKLISEYGSRAYKNFYAFFTHLDS